MNETLELEREEGTGLPKIESVHAMLKRLAELGITAEFVMETYVYVYFPDLPIAIVAPGDTLTVLPPEEGYRITHPRPD